MTILLKSTVTRIFHLELNLTNPAFYYISAGLERSFSHEDVSVMQTVLHYRVPKSALLCIIVYVHI